MVKKMRQKYTKKKRFNPKRVDEIREAFKAYWRGVKR